MKNNHRCVVVNTYLNYMDSQLIASIITGICGILAALIVWFQTKRNNDILEEEYEEETKPDGTVNKKSKKRYK